MEKIIKNGIICVFDIMGYKNFIKNNTVFECAKNIKDIIVELPANVNKALLEKFKTEKEKEKYVYEGFKDVIKTFLKIIFI